jgi:hypothetical protein
MKRSTLCLAAFAALAPAAAPVWPAGINLLSNPDFGVSLSGWDVNSIFHDGFEGHPDAGSAVAVNNDPGPTFGVMLSQCVPAAPHTFELGAWVRVPLGQPAGAASLSVYWYPENACGGASLASSGIAAPTNGQWTWTGLTAAAPPGTNSARVHLVLSKTNAGGSLTAYFDSVRLLDKTPRRGDFDGNFRDDLLLAYDATSLKLWSMSDTLLLNTAWVTPALWNANWTVAGASDFDGDGKADLVVCNQATGQVQFWFMNGAASTGQVLLTSPLPPAWRIAATGDFNHDGKPDLLWRNDDTQQLLVQLLDGTTVTGTLTPDPGNAVDANWRVVAALDFDGDLNTDLLWYNDTSGKIVLWLMDANLVRSVGKFTTPASAGDANWKVVAAGDYGMGADGLYGTNDIVWRNDTSGNLVVWHMDRNGARTSGVFTNPKTPGLGYKVVGPR